MKGVVYGWNYSVCFGRILVDNDEANRSIQDTTDRAEKTSGSLLKGIGTAAKWGAALVGAGVAAVGAIAGVVAATSELNGDLARLRANASDMGFDYKNIEDGFKKVAAVTGETDSAVETLSNLMQSGFNDQQLASVIDDINGAAIRFSDTLKTEGIADGIQETFATGAAIGMFGELLERSGVNLEVFNEGLAEAKKNGTETDYVLQQLADLGLASAYEEYKKINPEISSAAEASANLEVAFANFGLALNPIITKIKEVTTAFLEWVTNSPTIQGAMDTINNVINSFDPSSMTSGFASIKEAVTNAFDFIQPYVMAVLNPVVDFVQEQVQKIVSFWQDNGQQIIAAVKNAFEGIKAIIDFVMPAVQFVIEMVWTAIKQVISGALDIIMGLVKTFSGLFTGDFSKMWEGVKQIFKGAIDLVIGWLTLTFVGGIRTLLTNLGKNAINLVKTMWDDIVKFFKEFGTRAQGLADDMAKGVVNYFQNLLTQAQNIFGTLRTFGASVWNSLKESVLGVARSIFEGVKSNFDNMLSSIRNIFGTVKSTIQGIWETVMSYFRGINLYSVGTDIIRGLINGIGSMAGAVWDKAKSIANSIGDSIRSALQIKSPSKVTYGLARFAGEGIEEGLEDSIPSVSKVAQKMAVAATPNMQTSNVNNSKSYNPSVTIVNHVPSLSPSELARKALQTQRQLAMEWGV